MQTQPALIDYQQPQPHTRRRIADLPMEERPLYRLHNYGSEALSTTELLALILGTATAPGLAETLLFHFRSLHKLARANKAQFLKIPGIGETQAGRLIAMIELSKRLHIPSGEERLKVTSPEDAAQMLIPTMRHLKQEELVVMLLNTRNQVLDTQTIYRGSLNSSVIRIAEIYRPAIEASAAAIIVAHNHPSGDSSPSPEDVAVTRQIVKAGELLNIDCLDHIIVGNTFASLKERGLGFS